MYGSASNRLPLRVLHPIVSHLARSNLSIKDSMSPLVSMYSYHDRVDNQLPKKVVICVWDLWSAAEPSENRRGKMSVRSIEWISYTGSKSWLVVK